MKQFFESTKFNEFRSKLFVKKIFLKNYFIRRTYQYWQHFSLANVFLTCNLPDDNYRNYQSYWEIKILCSKLKLSEKGIITMYSGNNQVKTPINFNGFSSTSIHFYFFTLTLNHMGIGNIESLRNFEIKSVEKSDWWNFPYIFYTRFQNSKSKNLLRHKFNQFFFI